MNEFTILTDDQTFGNNQLGIFKKYGTKCAMTDFAILLGGYVSRDYVNNKSLANRTGFYGIESIDENKISIVDSGGYLSSFKSINRTVATRPITSLYSMPSDAIYKFISDGIIKVQYGLYPQTATSANLQKELEKNYRKGILQLTGSTYTVDSRGWYETNKEFSPRTINEYEYNGKRYVRVIANSYFEHERFELSNMKYYRNDDTVWVEVEPVNWLVDKKTGLMISEKLLFAGIPYTNSMDIKKYMNSYFARDLIQSITIIQTKPMGYSRARKLLR